MPSPSPTAIPQTPPVDKASLSTWIAVTAALVAIARIAGETAPLLFTSFGNTFWSVALDQPISALPHQIFEYAKSPYDEWHRLAWAGSLVLIGLVLIISLLARFVTRSKHGGVGD